MIVKPLVLCCFAMIVSDVVVKWTLVICDGVFAMHGDVVSDRSFLFSAHQDVFSLSFVFDGQPPIFVFTSVDIALLIKSHSTCRDLRHRFVRHQCPQEEVHPMQAQYVQHRGSQSD